MAISITTQGLELKLDQFSGPMDLLLHMIRENQLNIYDIPISEITHSYLALIQKAKEIHYEVAGEYLVMASMLVLLKSRLLIPLGSLADEDSETDDDPRQDLVQKLLLYEEFQKAAQLLFQRPLLGRETFVREEADTWLKNELGGSDISNDGEIVPGNVFELSGLYDQLMGSFEKKLLQIETERFDFRDVFEQLSTTLRLKSQHVYDFSPSEWEPERIVWTILVFLELSKRGVLQIFQERNFFPILVNVLKHKGLSYGAVYHSLLGGAP